LMREGVAIGVIALRRAEEQLFTERQVAGHRLEAPVHLVG
jgi:hypothetical protein